MSANGATDGGATEDGASASNGREASWDERDVVVIQGGTWQGLSHSACAPTAWVHSSHCGVCRCVCYRCDATARGASIDSAEAVFRANGAQVITR